MSGRPANPIAWDSGNYSAGTDAWSNTAKRVDPGVRFWTPNGPDAAQYFNFVHGAALDGVAAVTKLVGQNPALNWGAGNTYSATKTCNKAAWSQKDQEWWAVGSAVTDSAVRSTDYGRTWVAITLGSSLTCLDVAVDASGNVSIISTARTVYYGTRSAYNSVAFAATLNALTAAPTGGALAFDSSTGRFIACYQTGGTAGHVDTSTNGTAWTSQTIPSTWSTWSGTGSPLIAAAAGVVIANYYDTVSAVMRVMRSTDGGTTWTSAFFPTPIAFTPSLVHRAVYDEVNAIWYMAIAATSPSRATAIYKSTDGGATWSFAVQFTTSDWFCNGLVALGSLLVMANDDGRIAWSTDGASWFFVAGQIQSTPGTAAVPLGLRAGGGGMVLINSADKVAYVSQRFGDYGQAL